jgi:hypothetical protein
LVRPEAIADIAVLATFVDGQCRYALPGGPLPPH